MISTTALMSAGSRRELVPHDVLKSKFLKKYQRNRVISIDKLRIIVSDLMRFGDTTLPVAASRLGTSPRSLQRYLVASGISYSEFVDEVRYEIARSLLASTKLDVAGIGAMLGYRDPSSFSRAFMRWSGTSPSCFREEANLMAEQNVPEGKTQLMSPEMNGF